MKRLIIIMTLCISCISAADAQSSFTQKLQKSKNGEGQITITQDKAIDDLVNAPIVTSKPKPNANTLIDNKTKPTTTPTTKPKQAHIAAVNDTVVGELVSDSLNTTPKHVFKITGYRVQVLAGGNTRQDRHRAEQAGRSLRTLFPGEEVYVHFYSPRWICRMGNYRTYEEAHEKMLEVRKLGYSTATIVKGKITVTEEIK